MGSIRQVLYGSPVSGSACSHTPMEELLALMKYMANHNIDTIDIGVGVLSMHAPYELISKVDLYEGHRAFAAFYRF